MRLIYISIGFFILIAITRIFIFPLTPQTEENADSFIIESYIDGSWQLVAKESFPGRPHPDRYTQKTFAFPAPSDRVRITHGGGTQVAHIDQVVIDDLAPIAVKDLLENTELSAKKFANADYDVADGGKRTIEFSWNQKGSSLSVTGVAEDYKGVPYQWPKQGYLSYRIGAPEQTYTFNEIPVSSHPFSTRYSYFSSDKDNLYVYIDWTSDNTLDLDTGGDWAEVGVMTKDGLKTFLINGYKTEWGTSKFTYTDKVTWQHKVYMFTIPLSEIGVIANQSIQAQIRYYGTDGGSGGGDAGGGASGGGDAGGGPSGGGDAGGGPSGGGDAGGGGAPPPPPPIAGCPNPAATNFNPAAMVDDGSCVFPPPPPPPPPPLIAGCPNPAATNFNPAAMVDDGSCVFPPPPPPPPPPAPAVPPPVVPPIVPPVIPPGTPSIIPICVLTTNQATIQAGNTATLSWTTTNAVTFSIDNGIGSVTPVPIGSVVTSALGVTTTFTGTAISSTGNTVICAVTITVLPPPGGGGGGGGGVPAPTIMLTALPHVSAQPLAFLYLSQIPYTGLDLGPFGTILYWLALIGWALAFAYLVLFGGVPLLNRSVRNFGIRVKAALNARVPQTAPAQQDKHARVLENDSFVHKTIEPEIGRGYSTYDGFKSFAKNGALSIEDIVKGLSSKPTAELVAAYKRQHAEPIYEGVEPVYENVEPITVEPHVRGFVAALLEGDRVAVFAGLRQHVRGAGTPEKLLSETVCLLDDAYRARIDGGPCDPYIARAAARLSTPTLEKIVSSLTSAIDSSYSEGVIAAKLALTRALTTLGA